MRLILLLLAVLPVAAQQRIVRLELDAFERLAPRGRRNMTPGPGAHWLVPENELGPKARAAGFDRVMVLEGAADKSTNFYPAQETVSPNPNDEFAGWAWHFGAINAQSVWTGHGQPRNTAVKIVIIDTGVDLVPDLVDNIDQANSKGFSSAKTFTDVYGHGTMVAGVAGAVGNNGIGVVGIDWTADILSYNVCEMDKDEAGIEYLSCPQEYILKALISLLDMPAERIVVNISLVGGYSGDLLKEAIKALGDKALVVAAAGNGGSSEPLYPASFSYDVPNVMGVVATNREGRMASWSSFGGWLTIAAPGECIPTTGRNGTYPFASGTSMAAPVVAGVASLLWKSNPTLSPIELRRIIVAGAKSNPALVERVAGGLQLDYQGSIDALNSFRGERTKN